MNHPIDHAFALTAPILPEYEAEEITLFPESEADADLVAAVNRQEAKSEKAIWLNGAAVLIWHHGKLLRLYENVSMHTIHRFLRLHARNMCGFDWRYHAGVSTMMGMVIRRGVAQRSPFPEPIEEVAA